MNFPTSSIGLPNNLKYDLYKVIKNINEKLKSLVQSVTFSLLSETDTVLFINEFINSSSRFNFSEFFIINPI